jgi:hypothetical protein
MPSRSDLFLEMPLTLTFEGEFSSVFGFLRSAEEMQRLTRVRGMTLRVKDPRAGQVHAEVAMNLYFSLE